jgi:amino acid adenylation domain-containing protein
MCFVANSQKFWIKVLTGVPALLDLPTDRPRVPRQSFTYDQVSIHLDASLTLGLRGLALKHNVGLDIVILAGWSAVLARLSGQEDIVIGFGKDDFGLHIDQFVDKTLPLRIDLSGEPNTVQLLEHLQSVALSGMTHQGMSLQALMDLASTSRESHSPLFQVAFQWHNHSRFSSPVELSHERPKSVTISNDVELHLMEQDDQVIGELKFSAAIFELVTIKRHVGYLNAMLRLMVENPTQPVATHDILSPEERKLVLETWNETSETYQEGLCFHQLFEVQADKTPNATAIVHEGQVLSYGELNSRANQLSHHLIELGVRHETRVAICTQRSLGMIIGILAIMKAGGVYVPLDPKYTGGRLMDILHDAGPTIVVADGTGKSTLGGHIMSSMQVVNPNVLLDHPVSNPNVPGLTSRHLAYILYTSGSTGKPKGVMIEHRGVVNLAQTHTKFCGIHQDSRVLQFASLSFDASIWDIMLPLSCGASLYLPLDSVRQDRDKLWEYMGYHSMTHASFTPSFLQDGKNLPTLDTPLTLVLGGEPLGPALLHTLIGQGYTVINDFGPTETTVSAATWRCPSDFKSDIVPIGRPVIHSRLYILDKFGQPVPLGAVGELYIGGVAVARGYLNRPELTAQVFLPDPFTVEPSARMFKTGDLARYLPDGNVVFLGRNDHQVKIRGFRIELGEIEIRLSEHPLVDKAVVVALGEGNTKRLVAYVVSEPHSNLVHTLRSHLTSCLPDYMVPAAIVRLDSLPLNSNDKLDLKSLPLPDSSAFVRQDFEEPQGEVEITIAQIWSEMLNIDKISRNDNFFALGGHSLLAVQMIDRLRRIGLTIPVGDLFKNPTLQVLSQTVDRYQDRAAPSNLITLDTTEITPNMLPLISLTQREIDHVVNHVPGGVSNIQDIYALSPLQEGILFHHLLETKGDPYLLISCTVFEGRQLLDRYLEAIQRVVDRHDILRTGIVWENMSTPAQVVWRQAPLSITELQLDPADGPIKDQLMTRLDPRVHRINVSQAPLMRFTIAKDSGDRWFLAELQHHLIGDHSTLDIMQVEVTAFMDGQGDTLPPPQPFRNLIAQVRSGKSHSDHERFFTEMLGDIDTPSLPFGLKDVHGHGGDIVSSYRDLPQDLNDRLRRHAKHLGVSVASLCHLAWAMVISRTSGEDRVVFGTVLFGRMQSGQGSDSAMGLFINTLPLRVDIQGGVRESVLQTHERLASLLDHEHASLALTQRCSNIPQGTPLFSSLLNYRHNTAVRENTSIYPGIDHVESIERTNYPMTLSVEDYGSSLGLTTKVVQSLSPSSIGQYMQQALQSLVDMLERDPDIAVDRLNIIPEEESRLLLHTWNTTQEEYPAHLCIHHLFEQQVERTPEATAVVINGQSLTYTELNERVNRLAHHLIELGVELDTRVAICVDRSVAMIVGVLAILKAGGAYVPLDPTYTSSRLRDILVDVNPTIVIADESGQRVLGQEALHSVRVIDPNTTLVGSEGLR